MRLHILAIGTRMPAWVDTGFHDYAKRLRGTTIRLRELEAARRSKDADIARAMADEGERLLAAVPKGALVIALDRLGTSVSTQRIATAMQEWRQGGRDIAFLIGGPEGLSEQCIAAAHERWSLSALTLPHMLVRIVLAEQLYRAWSILERLPYHR
jgi:23S rRNA (pseudouridine1915-N3)-methyltransferase